MELPTLNKVVYDKSRLHSKPSMSAIAWLQQLTSALLVIQGIPEIAYNPVGGTSDCVALLK
jgi:hypothetical protein